MGEVVKGFIVFKHYHYSEIYYIEAENQEAAIEYLETESPECDNIYQEFDFYDVVENKSKDEK